MRINNFFGSCGIGFKNGFYIQLFEGANLKLPCFVLWFEGRKLDIFDFRIPFSSRAFTWVKGKGWIDYGKNPH